MNKHQNGNTWNDNDDIVWAEIIDLCSEDSYIWASPNSAMYKAYDIGQRRII